MHVLEKVTYVACGAVGVASLAFTGVQWWNARADSTAEIAPCAPYEEAVRDIFGTVAPPEAISIGLTDEECAGSFSALLEKVEVEITELNGTDPSDFDELRRAFEAAERDPRLLPRAEYKGGVTVDLTIGALRATLESPGALTLDFPERLARFAESPLPVRIFAWDSPSRPDPGSTRRDYAITIEAPYDASAPGPAQPASEAWAMVAEFAEVYGGTHSLVIATPEGTSTGEFTLDVFVPGGTTAPDDLDDLLSDVEALAAEIGQPVVLEDVGGSMVCKVNDEACPGEHADAINPVLETLESWTATAEES